MLLHDVHDEDGCGNAVHVGNRTEVLFQLGALTADLQTLALGHGRQRTVGLHLVDLRHLADGLADRSEVGQHASRPALCDVGHVHGLSRFLHKVLGLLFGRNEKNPLSAFGDLLRGGGRLVHENNRLVQIDDVNALLLREDVRGHVWVPLALEVAEVGSCLKQLVEIGACHDATFLGLGNGEVASDEGPHRLDASCICCVRVSL